MNGPVQARDLEPRSGPLLKTLERRTAETPNSAGILAPGLPTVSFRDLLLRIRAIAAGLHEFGLSPGDVVAICMPDGPELLTAMLGAMQTVALAPLDWKFTEAELRSRLALMPARCLWTAAGSDSRAAAAARALGIPVIEARFSSDGAVAFAVLNDTGADALPNRNCVSGEIALILQTSATTSAPKLVPLTRDNVEAICENAQSGLPFDSQDRYLSLMPLHHVLGFACAAAQLTAGGSVVSTSGFDAGKLLLWLREFRPSWYTAGPTLQRAMLELAKQNREAFRDSFLRFTRSGSGASSPALLDELEEVLGITVINGYGLTEVGLATSTAGRPRKPNSVGRARGLEIEIRHPSGRSLPPGEEGEVVMRGAAITPGYLNDAVTNAEVFRHGWFHTGDLGRLDEDADLFITGRIKEIINRGGEAIAPLEIDHVLMEHPAVAQAACFSVPHPTLVEDVAAAVVLRSGSQASERELRNFLSSRLSAAKALPGGVFFVDSIPVSASGKPLRKSLSEQFQARQETANVVAGSEWTPLEQTIAAVWASILPNAPTTPDDDFFSLGGDSLSAARMVSLVETKLGLDARLLEHPEVFASPTIADLARLAADSLSTQNSAIHLPGERTFQDVSAVRLQTRGGGPPVLFFPAEKFEPWYLRHLARALGDRQPFIVLRHQLTEPVQFDGFAARFVELIRTIRPHGPMVIAGHCYGGMLAYEVGRRLIEAGETGVTVVLVDVPAPGYPKVRLSRYLRQLPRAFGEIARGRGTQLIHAAVAHLNFLREKRYAIRTDVADAVDAATNQLSPAAKLLRTYSLQRFPGRILHIIAEDQNVSTEILEDPRLGWRDLLKGALDEYPVRGGHNSVFDEQGAAEIAGKLQTIIAQSAR